MSDREVEDCEGKSQRRLQNAEGESMAESVEKDVPEFDWVTRRSECSLPHIFRQLGNTVKADVATRNALRPANSPYEFSMKEDISSFTVRLEGKGLSKSILFCLAEHAIVVKDDKGYQIFDVAVKFNEKGECKLIANDEERALWEIRRMALEELMFRTS
ncbi:MAG: hypothetical protein ABR976_20380 [Terracidiphilus sp.]